MFRLIGSQTQSYEVVRRFPLICEQLPYPELRLFNVSAIYKHQLRNRSSAASNCSSSFFTGAGSGACARPATGYQTWLDWAAIR